MLAEARIELKTFSSSYKPPSTHGTTKFAILDKQFKMSSCKHTDPCYTMVKQTSFSRWLVAASIFERAYETLAASNGGGPPRAFPGQAETKRLDLTPTSLKKEPIILDVLDGIVGKICAVEYSRRGRSVQMFSSIRYNTQYVYAVGSGNRLLCCFNIGMWPMLLTLSQIAIRPWSPCREMHVRSWEGPGMTEQQRTAQDTHRTPQDSR